MVRIADFEFNIAKGRFVELYNRVDTNDPANSALVIVVLSVTNIESDTTLKRYVLLSTLLAASNDEVTNTNYARKVLTDTDLSAISPDQVNDRMDVDVPDQTWTSVASGTNWAKLLVCYDNDTTSGTDANIIPCLATDFAVTPDGTDILAQINTAGLFRAT